MAVPAPREDPAAAEFPPASRTSDAAGYGRLLAALVRARWPQIAVFLTALFAIDLIRHYSYRGWLPGALLGHGVPGVVVGITFIVGGGSVAGTLMAEALEWRGIPRVIATVAFALAGAALALGAIALWIPVWLDTALDQSGVPQSAFVLRNLWYYTATSVLFSAFFVSRERDLAITRAAQAAELERGNVQRIVMESRLKVIQARVEPELLFDVLADVQRLYASAPGEAEARLDDLIVYLRAALPQMRSDTSTLGRETALAAAFVKVTTAGREGSLTCANRIPADLEDLPFPPMVLLRLVHAAADARARQVVLEGVAQPGDDPARVALTVTVTVPSGAEGIAWQPESLEGLHAIVRSHFGAEARLDIAASGEGQSATIACTLPRSAAHTGELPSSWP